MGDGAARATHWAYRPPWMEPEIECRRFNTLRYVLPPVSIFCPLSEGVGDGRPWAMAAPTRHHGPELEVRR